MEWLLTPWKLAMLGLLAFLLMHRLGGRWSIHKLRTWAALFFCSTLAGVVTPEHGTTPYLSYVLLCGIAARVILLHPAGEAQRAIGLFFVAMVAFHTGAATAGVPIAPEPYVWVLNMAGWAQFIILLVWSLWDAGLGKMVDVWSRRLGRPNLALSHLGGAR